MLASSRTYCRLLVAVGLPIVIFCAGRLIEAEESSSSAPAALSPEDVKFFETHIRPLFAQRCLNCHGPDKQQGNLRLDSRAAILAGGASGPALAPSNPEKSLLLEAVRYESLEMPPDGRLTAEQITHLQTWIAHGALWPQEAAPEGPTVRRSAGFTDADRAWWAFQPLERHEPPAVQNAVWCKTPVDAFVLARMETAGLKPADEADRRTLVRRATFDLWGLPPTPEMISQFLEDDSPEAYPRLIDRLLASPRYGERWARHWLDLVRYADSNGHKADEYRPEAWRYRDWVIRALNEDLPYDQFVAEQIAGDEIAPNDPDVVVATGFLRHTPYESNQVNVAGQWADILNDVTDVVADVFLGLGFSCARCHDHKYDPILQRDYYRLQAFFTPMTMPTDTPLATAEQQQQLSRWREMTQDVRRRMAELESPHREQLARPAIKRFPPDVQALIGKPVAQRTPYEHQLATLAFRQVEEKFSELPKRMASAEGETYKALQAKLAAFEQYKPRSLPMGFVVRDVGRIAPSTTIPDKRNAEPIEPGYLTLLWPAAAKIAPPTEAPDSTGRRSSLARWLTQPDNRLTTRVIVNRLWQYHFGVGLVRTASDFGRLGQPPSHPKLLDYLATELPAKGWSLKEMHRLIMNSAVYRQAATGQSVQASLANDPDNRLWARMRTRRLDAEQIRDAALAVSGELDLQTGGPGADCGTSLRRSIYLKVLRNAPDELLQAFDVADSFHSRAQRIPTTTPTQSLMMINGPWMMARANALAKRLASEEPTGQREQIERAYLLCYARRPSEEELAAAEAFLTEQTVRAGEAAGVDEEAAMQAAWVDFCHVLLNANEFLYLD